MLIQFIGPPLNPLPLQEIPRKLTDLDTDINTDFDENSPYQEGFISERSQRSDKSYSQEPPEFESLVSTGKLVQTFYLNMLM